MIVQVQNASLTSAVEVEEWWRLRWWNGYGV